MGSAPCGAQARCSAMERSMRKSIWMLPAPWRAQVRDVRDVPHLRGRLRLLDELRRHRLGVRLSQQPVAAAPVGNGETWAKWGRLAVRKISTF